MNICDGRGNAQNMTGTKATGDPLHFNIEAYVLDLEGVVIALADHVRTLEAENRILLQRRWPKYSVLHDAYRWGCGCWTRDQSGGTRIAQPRNHVTAAHNTPASDSTNG